MANSGDPDQMLHFVASDLGLHCLPVTLFSVSRLQWVKRLYLLNFWMEVVHPCTDVRYWSEILCCTIPTYMSDLEVKVMDLEASFDGTMGVRPLPRSTTLFCGD